jgi:hypothetical protein
MTLPSSGHQTRVMTLSCMAERNMVSSRSNLLISTRCLWVTLPSSGHHKKKKITLQDVSLSKKDGPMEASKEVIAQSGVESVVESTKGDEAKLQEGHNQEAKDVIESKAQSVADLKTKEQIATVVVYRHPHHIEMKKSSRQGHVHEHIYAPTGHQAGKIKTGQPRHDAEKDKGAKVADRHHV